MSNPDDFPADPARYAATIDEDQLEILEARVGTVGTSLTIRRALPAARRRTVGAWCFLDHFGPASFQQRKEGIWVGQHPHIGLQTVTWLFDGQVLHRDSLGTVQRIESGGLNLMTAGQGISHTEESPHDHDGSLHGVQFWLALPPGQASRAPAFEHHGTLPTVTDDGLSATVFIGEGLGVASPAGTFSPLVGAEVRLAPGRARLPLEATWEHALMVTDGSVEVEGSRIGVGQLLYLKPGRREVLLHTTGSARLILAGGEPLTDPVVLWWNFVARSDAEIREALADWQQGQRFGEVTGFEGERLVAPPLLGHLKV